MMDGFNKEWVIEFMQGKESYDHRRAYASGRDDIIEGRTPTDEGLFAYSIPKIVSYAQHQPHEENIMDCVDRLVSEEDSRMAGWGLDLSLPSDLEILNISDVEAIMREGAVESHNDGYFSMVGHICETVEEYQEQFKKG